MINVRGTISNPTICLIKCKSLLIWLQNIQRWIGPGPFSLMTLHNPHMYLYFVLHLTLPLSTSLFLQFSEPNPTAPTCEPSLEGGATPPYPPMLQLRLLLNWPLWCGHDHKKTGVEVSFSVNLRWTVCVGPILFHDKKKSSQFYFFSCPGQLNRWPCHSLSQWHTFWFQSTTELW